MSMKDRYTVKALKFDPDAEWETVLATPGLERAEEEFKAFASKRNCKSVRLYHPNGELLKQRTKEADGSTRTATQPSLF